MSITCSMGLFSLYFLYKHLYFSAALSTSLFCASSACSLFFKKNPRDTPTFIFLLIAYSSIIISLYYYKTLLSPSGIVALLFPSLCFLIIDKKTSCTFSGLLFISLITLHFQSPVIHSMPQGLIESYFLIYLILSAINCLNKTSHSEHINALRKSQHHLQGQIQETQQALDVLQQTNKIAKIGGWTIHVETNYLWWSHEIYSIYGVPFGKEMSPEEAIQFYDKSTQDLIVRLAEEAIYHNKKWDIEVDIFTVKRRKSHIRLTGEQYIDSKGEIFLRGTVQDINDRKEAEQKIYEANAKALQASQAKNQFLANMSHEIRTPMNGILASAEILKNYHYKEDQQQWLNIIQKSGETMMSLLNDILDISKLDDNKVNLKYRNYDSHLFMQNIYDIFKPQSQKKSLDFQLNIDDSFPRWVTGDPEKTQRILTNLISNAIKFTEYGSVSISVRIDQAQDHLLFNVEDTGIGFDHKDYTSLFEEFSQADASTTRKFGGSGLGLAICSKTTQLLGGKIQCHSTPNKGTRFSVSIPYQKGVEIIEKKNKPLQLSNLKNIRSLIVEDNEMNMTITEKFLSNLKIKPDKARNGEEACIMLLQNQYDVIFMDCQMPVLDGFKATQKIRSMPLKNQPFIIALTANTLKDDQTKCLSAGMNDYLTKPVTRRNIEDALQKYLENNYRAA